MNSDKVLVIVINGHPGSGKDTFVDCFMRAVDERGKKVIPVESNTISVVNYHTSNPMKVALETLGWDGEKTPEVRNLLASLKQECNKLFDTTMKCIEIKHNFACKDSQANFPVVLFIHSREPEEILEIKKRYGALTLLVSRPDMSMDKRISNASDLQVNELKYDAHVMNAGTIQDLDKTASVLLNKILSMNLCDTCANRPCIPHCSDDAVLGLGKGYDNVVSCRRYL